MSNAPTRIIDVVLCDTTPQRSSMIIPLLIAVLLHALIAALALHIDPPLEIWDPATSIKQHTDIEIVLEPHKTQPPHVQRRSHTSPAQAGKIVAAEPAPTEPVDFTENTFVTGTVSTFAGGTTTSKGTSTTAVQEELKHDDASKPVQLNNNAWRCPWPKEAYSAEINEQTVILRATIRADGSVVSVLALSDPGYGFAEAAVQCAQTAAFTAARNAEGHPIEALSPPIRVRFTR